ncbi:MAG: LysE family transporter [Bacteroidia bacterium]|nr:LysE family transporter [Bacteroidia bacterium]
MRRSRGIRYLLEGILLNILNPFVYIFWLGIVSYLTVSQNYAERQILLFLAGASLPCLWPT